MYPQRRLQHLQLKTIPVAVSSLSRTHILDFFEFGDLCFVHLIEEFLLLIHFLQFQNLRLCLLVVDPFFAEWAEHLAGLVVELIIQFRTIKHKLAQVKVLQRRVPQVH